ncbi:hypothetical protein HK405_011616 [Cladochytrium tenue]|nr:hypothetical protein HK405_011616 [Cladochytrium tenue]
MASQAKHGDVIIDADADGDPTVNDPAPDSGDSENSTGSGHAGSNGDRPSAMAPVDLGRILATADRPASHEQDDIVVDMQHGGTGTATTATAGRVAGNSSATASVSGSLAVGEAVGIMVEGLTVRASRAALHNPVRLRATTAGDAGTSKPILADVSLHVPPGQLMAIMGGSGSGKTTLLNALAGRGIGKITGKILFNGRLPGYYIRRRAVAYVQQQDSLLPYLTVRDTLRYAARLRLPRSMTLKEKYAMVERVILELGLKECAGTIIGDEWRKGISGGEKRRVSVGVQLLVNPSVIFMDEPTTGLDAFSAWSLVETLKSLCRNGRTIVISIHQPRSDIFSSFEHVTLLSRGQLCYSGPREGAVPFIESLGYPLVGNVNGADFLIDATTVDDRTLEAEEESKARLTTIVASWASRSPVSSVLENMKAENIEADKVESKRAFAVRSPSASILEQIQVLIGRLLRNMSEDRLTLWGSLVEVLIMSIVIGYIFYHLDSTQYFMAGLRTDSLAYHLGVFILGNCLMHWVTLSFGFACISLSREFASASLYGNALVTFLSISSGFFIPIDTVPIYLRWFERIDYLTYGLRILIANEFSSNNFGCSDISCDGDAVIVSLGFTPNDIRGPAVGLIVIFAVKVLFAAIFLQLLDMGQEKQGGKVKPPRKTFATASAADGEGLEHDPASVGITLEKFTMTFRTTLGGLFASRVPVGEKRDKLILQSVTASFEPGRLTAILGVSGAGKSTLLQQLHHRLPQLPGHVVALREGRILHNGKELSRAEIMACTASVRQDDSHLLPALTARETLQYAALLRLPQSVSRARRLQRAEEVLVELGLKECADTLVGGGGVHGLSGGEKRRVSVGLALLTDPAVLLLDEPTSGLDAATARHMMETLKRLASTRGRTVVCTLHQPRSDIFPLLDRVLLLARGGRVVYDGAPARLVPHLAARGLVCPPLTNPADFALDVSSVDLRRAEAEEESRKRVDELVAAWKEARLDAQTPAANATAGVAVEEVGTAVLGLPGAAEKGRAARQLPLLISRSFTNLRRQPRVLFARIVQVTALAVILTLYFVNLNHNQGSVTSRLGILQQVGSVIFIGMLNCLAVFPQELQLYRFESQDGVYGAGSFFWTYTVNELPFEVFGSLFFALFFVFAVGMQANVILVAFTVLAFLNTGESIGIAFCAFQGFLSVSMPRLLDGLNYLSILRYGSRAVAVPVFSGMPLDCDAGAACIYQTGDDVLALLGFPSDYRAFAGNVAAMTACAVIYRTLAYFALRWRAS